MFNHNNPKGKFLELHVASSGIIIYQLYSKPVGTYGIYEASLQCVFAGDPQTYSLIRKIYHTRYMETFPCLRVFFCVKIVVLWL